MWTGEGLVLCCSALLLQLVQLSHSSPDPTKICIHKGCIHGNRHSILSGKIVHEYLGIPMGKPPIREKRFRRPEAVERWNGDYNATVRSHACYNVLDYFFGKFPGSDMWNPPETMSEDCLYINAWIPNPDDKSQKKPIMVWIYGGGFYSGSNTLDVYDGRYLAASQNVIVISMQYRLGILGFLNLESELAPGNMGLLDQLMGLQWTQDNAEYFHGDKNNVTIVGESAGSVSVSLHLISPKSRNLFNRAIMQSGSSTADWSMMSTESSWTRFNRTVFGLLIGCPKTTNVPKLMNCLLNLDAGKLFNNSWAPNGLIQFSWLPSVDYYFLYEKPETSLIAGNFKKCPILIGSNANEGSWFLVYEFFGRKFGGSFKSDEINFTIPHSDHVENMHYAFRYYPQWPTKLNSFGKDAITFRYTDWRNKDDSALNRYNLDMAISDYFFLCPANKYAHYFVKADMPVYYFYFTHRSSVNPWGKWMGVMHGDEISFTFGMPLRSNSLYTDDEKLLSSHMMQLWSNFSKTGHPNGLDSDRTWLWPTSSLYGREYYELSVPSMKKPMFGSGPRTEYCAFWDNYLPDLVKGTADIHDVEKEWKDQFDAWNNQYIVNWKHEYNSYLHSKYKDTACPGQDKDEENAGDL